MTQSDIGIVELKPCPFCGGEARAMGRDSGFIYCLNDACGAEVRTPRDSENDDALAARLWNTRDSIITEMVEALEAAADAMTCRRDDDAHYCPNCDNSLHEARDKSPRRSGQGP